MLEIEPLSDEQLIKEKNSLREHADKTFARWRQAVNEDDPASGVWFDIALKHGQMYLIVKALVDYRRNA